MSDYQVANTANLFDFDTNEFVGVIGPDGKEKMLPGGSGALGPVVPLTTSRNITSGDNGGTLVYAGSSDIVLTFVAGMPAGFSCTIIQAGTGKVSATQGAGVGFDNSASTQGINTFFTSVMGTVDQYAFQNPVPRGPVPLIQSAIPFVLASGSIVMGNNGAFTGMQALNTTYPDAYTYWPVDSIAVGVPAGWYYTVFSSTSAGTVYNNRYTGGQPSLPASPTAFATTGPGAVTQTLTLVSGPQVTLPGGSMGPNGRLDATLLALANNTASSRVAAMRLNAISFSSPSALTGSTITADAWSRLDNAGKQNRQTLRSNAAFGQGTTAPGFGSIDTASDQTFDVSMTLAGSADYLIVLRHSVNVTYGA